MIVDEGDILDGTVWDRFCELLMEAKHVILRPETPADSQTRAEGFRYLTRLLRAALEFQVEHSNPCYPQLFSLADETKKIGNDNPDALYQNAIISGKYDYRLKGKLGSPVYLGFGTKAGSYATTGRQDTTGELELADLKIDENGQFEIIISARPHEGNWLPMRVDTHSLLIRQIFNDRKNDPWTDLDIECLNPDQSDAIEPTTFGENLLKSVDFVRNTANLFVDWMEIYRKHLNQLPSDDQDRCVEAGGDPKIHYLQSFWKLAPDEALIIDFAREPVCRTWNFQLSNYWMESLDYRYHRIAINKSNVTRNPDGSVTIVVAHSDPGAAFPNWLTTAGHGEGGNLFRWIEADDWPPVTTKVVKLDALNASKD